MNKPLSASASPRYPLSLPWLAKRAGVKESRARELWQDAWQHAAQQSGNTDSPEFFACAGQQLELLLTQESRKLDGKNSLRPWTRLQRQVWSLQLTWLEASARIAQQTWRQNLEMQRQLRSA